MKISKERLQQRTFFQEIPLEQRSKYRKKVLQTQQFKGQQPVFYIDNYPNQAEFDYDGIKLHYYYRENYKNPASVVFFFHGMYFHGNTSGYLSKIIGQHASAHIYALDFKNAGKSEGDCPGYYESIQSLIDQAQKFMDHILFKYDKKTNVFVMGQSMGGLIAFKLCVKNPMRYKGAVLLCPALGDCYQNIPILKKIGRAMGYLFPRLKLIPQDQKGMTKYQNLEFLKKDQGRYRGNHPPGTAYKLLKQLDTLGQSFKDMKTPYICIQAGMDTAVDLFAPLDLEKQCQIKDKTTVYFKNMWHDLLVEEEIKEVSGIVVQWIKQRS